jgi:2-C-methyl-D-erythritol 4-phosphate cytidylyltransferase
MSLINYGLILASGSGTRFSSDLPKQFAKIAGKTVIEYTIDVFEKSNCIDKIILVMEPNYRYLLKEILLKNNYKKVIKVLNGGETRKESSSIGVSSIDDAEANVFIHDCARPFLSNKIIEECHKALNNYSAVDVAIKAVDTIIDVDSNKEICNIPKREHMQRGQTPQCFKLSLIRKAHELAKNDDSFTDDCGLIVKNNLAKVFVVNGDENNIKITNPSDIFLADKIFQSMKIDAPEDVDLFSLRNKVFVIIGGTEGIGKCISDMAISYGAKTYSFSRRNGVNVADYDKINSKFKDVYNAEGKIDYVINTSGVLNIGKIEQRDIVDIKDEISINYIGSINVVKACIPYLKKSKGGILLFTSSSYTKGRALYSVYSSTKAAIVNLSQALSEELYNDGVTVNAINPERTATSMRLNNFGKEPSGSLLDPNSVAAASLRTIVSNITGQVISVRIKYKPNQPVKEEEAIAG